MSKKIFKASLIFLLIFSFILTGCQSEKKESDMEISELYIRINEQPVSFPLTAQDLNEAGLTEYIEKDLADIYEADERERAGDNAVETTSYSVQKYEENEVVTLTYTNEDNSEYITVEIKINSSGDKLTSNITNIHCTSELLDINNIKVGMTLDTFKKADIDNVECVYAFNKNDKSEGTTVYIWSGEDGTITFNFKDGIITDILVSYISTEINDTVN